MATDPQQVILSIAGSDPSGGAGIQADLKTFATLGVYGAAAVTCLTVQNTRGVFSINPVAPHMVRDQAEKVLTDMHVSHIKLGMLGNREIVRGVGEILEHFRGEVVCDPILRSSSGKTLLEDNALDAFREKILARATALTPNFPEFQALTGIKGDDDDAIAKAVANLFRGYPRLAAITLKGGHRKVTAKEIIDTLFLRAGKAIKTVTSRRPRITTDNTHGTGCTFASALAAHHQKTNDWEKAFHQTCTYLDHLIFLSADTKMGQGPGPLLHHLYPQISKP